MHGPLRRLCVAGIGLAGLFFTGCLQVPYCFPEVSYAPAVDAKCKSAEVYCFRVDVTQRIEIKELTDAMHGEAVDHEELTQIQPSAQGTTSGQVGVSLASGWRYVGLWNFSTSSTGHAIALRFYRPGFESIVLRPGEFQSELRWREAADLIDEVKAVDDLMDLSPAKASRANAVSRHALEPGTKSAAHRKALLFGASEYERLAGACSASDSARRELRADLLDKANHLRTLAK